MRDLAIWLYGSFARGDADDRSDVDLLIIGDDKGHPSENLVSQFDAKRLSKSRYEWSELQRMARYGSLFLHHLRIEAGPLYEDEPCRGRLRAILDRLPPYSLAARDIRSFELSAIDIERNVADPDLQKFELAAMAALIRRIAILVCSLRGEPRFDRLGAFFRLVALWDLPGRFADEFPSLYSYRQFAEGEVEPRNMDPTSLATLWVPRMKLMIKMLSTEALA